MLAGAAVLASAPAMNAEMWLIGAPQGWDIEDGSIPLTETSAGVYETNLNINSGQFMFRFYTALGNWDANSIGIAEGDVDVTIEFTDNTWFTGTYVDGKGNWNYPSWKGGEIYITVNTNLHTVIFTTDPNADIPQAMPDMYIRGANINGADGWGAVNKMTYDYTKQVYTWSGSVLGSGFKFADDAGWNGNYNIGSNGSPIQVDVPYSYYNGGDSGNIVFSSNAEVVNNPYVVLDVNKGTVLLTGNSEEQEVSLTIAGTMNDWMGNDPDYQLTKDENGKYTGTFYMFPESQFQVVLLGSTWYGNTDGIGEIDLTEGASTVGLGTGYENNFTLVDWRGGDVNFSVTVTNNTPVSLTVEGIDAGVESILGASDGKEVIFNMQGVRVSRENLVPGIYIINGKKALLK